jgi:DNA-binding NarL/FixJ family response regulator
MPPPPVRPAAPRAARPPLAAALSPIERAGNDPRVDPPASCLSRRERAVVVALCEGLDRPEIACRLRRSRSTCDKVISAIYRNTGFGTAHQVVAWAHRIGLFGGAARSSAGPRR